MLIGLESGASGSNVTGLGCLE